MPLKGYLSDNLVFLNMIILEDIVISLFFFRSCQPVDIFLQLNLPAKPSYSFDDAIEFCTNIFPTVVAPTHKGRYVISGDWTWASIML